MKYAFIDFATIPNINLCQIRNCSSRLLDVGKNSQSALTSVIQYQ